MDLATVSVTGFRRFKDRNTLQTNGKLVAILGPNEAGKSSLLRAIELLGSDDPPNQRDFCRGADRSTFEIQGRFHLSSSDLKLAGLAGSYWLTVRKGEAGTREYSLDPKPPKRDLTLRGSLRSLLNSLFSNSRFLSHVDTLDEAEDIVAELTSVDAILSREDEDLTPNQIEKISTFGALVAPLIDDRMSLKLRTLPDVFAKTIESEREPNPQTFAISELVDRVPAVVIFGDEERNLLPEYELAQLQALVPMALDNLFDLAGVIATDFVDVMGGGDPAAISTIENKTNLGLETNFKVYWQQSKIKVSIRAQGERLFVQVINENSDFTSFAERSDGLRQFVALIAFASGRWADGPIMLIDEAEQRLHYDAQADLVQMLGRQQVASKIIYTTHSAGCLPEDLGNGVHIACPTESDPTCSRINNKFWADNEPGFTALLFGMGASTLAFFPTRHAVMVEGPSDMLLLPTLMRFALGLEVLGFQFVPGLSYTDGFIQSPAIGLSNGVVYLVDGDDGGEKIKARLIELGASAKNVLTLASKDFKAVEVEDFLRRDLFVEGYNKIISKFHKGVGLLSVSDLPDEKQMAWLENRYTTTYKKKIAKVSLAYEILDLINSEPERSPIEPKLQSSFRSVAKQIESRFAFKPSDRLRI